jgi:beta-glucanase (GH16 family)
VGGACGSSPSISCLTPYSQSNDASNGVANSDTAWHTYGVEWTPSGVSWLIDGNVVLSAPSSQTPSGAQQPALPMLMTLQTVDLGGAGASSGTQTMAVDWVEQFSWNG